MCYTLIAFWIGKHFQFISVNVYFGVFIPLLGLVFFPKEKCTTWYLMPKGKESSCCFLSVQKSANVVIEAERERANSCGSNNSVRKQALLELERVGGWIMCT